MSGTPEQPTKAEYPNRWEERWSSGKIGWDQSSPHPSIVDLLMGGQGDELGVPREGTALIPGCGTGYDVHLLAQRGLESTGIDISPTGVAAARKWLGGQAQPKAKTQVVCSDFFEYDPEEKYDVILDYTFLCALPPSLRSSWSSHITVLSKPSSTTRLITLMFPLGLPMDGPGPPYPLSEGVYRELLDGDWEMVWSEEVREVRGRKVGGKGGENLAVWKRRI